MTRRIGALFAGLALSVGVVWPAGAEVPTVADFAACNMKAAEEAASDAVSASPRTEGAPRAGDLPRGRASQADGAGAARSDGHDALE